MKRALSMILILCLVCGLCGCRGPELRSPGVFYYYRTDTGFSDTEGVLAPENRELFGMEDDLDAILDLYCQGPLSEHLESPIPKDCPVLGHSLQGDTLTLDFSKGLSELSGIELTLAAGCLARTFLGLTGAEYLILTAEGGLLDGESSMTLSLADLGLRDDSQDRLHGDYTIYYTDADRRYLMGQSVSVFLSAREELPMLLLEQMCVTPADTAMRSVLPEGTRILSAAVSDGLCTVDLNREFVSRRFYSHSGQLLSLMGITNTLTALPEIDRVEFLVEGELLLRLGSISLSAPLVRDERFLGPVRTGLGERDSTIYLAHGPDMGLIPLPLRLRHSGAYSPAEQMVRFLLSDSGSNDFTACISPGTRLNSIHLSNRICRLDLSAEFLENPAALPGAIRVLTASVCTLEDISAVRITVDGAVPEGYPPSWFGVHTPKSDWFL